MKEGDFIMVKFLETFQNMFNQMATNGLDITEEEIIMIQLLGGLPPSWQYFVTTMGNTFDLIYPMLCGKMQQKETLFGNSSR
jgi:hypothetical protein